MKPSSYTKDYAHLRAWLKSKREAQELSLRDVAEIVGRHHSVIGKLEQTRRRIDIVEFVDYCCALGINPHEGIDVLLALREKKNPSA